MRVDMWMTSPRARAVALSVLVGLALLSGCGEPTACDQALDKVKSCGLTDAHLTQAGDQCQLYAACAATCVVKAGCNDIQANVQGDSNNALGACVLACGQ